MNNITGLDLNLLKALDALLDERNVTRAAQKLSLTQPAVSSMLNRLRQMFDDPLFVRVSHGIIPTERALALAAPIKQILADVTCLIQPQNVNPLEMQTTFKVAANDNDMHVVGLPFVLALKQAAPRVNVAFLSFHQLNVQAMMEKGELDLMLIDPVNAPAVLHSRTLYQERYVCVMRKGHPAAKHGYLTLDQFCALEHVLVSYQGGQFAGVTDEALAKLGRSRRVSLSITSFLLLPNILQQSDFIAVAPAYSVRALDNLIVLDPPITIPGYTKIMAWHERNHRDPIQQWLRQLMWQTCAECTC